MSCDALAERRCSAPATTGDAYVQFHAGTGIPLLTVTRTGQWSVATVAAHEIAFRQELVQLRHSGKTRGLIVDIGATWMQERDVAWALRRMEMRLGELRPERIAVVSSFGASRLHARHLKEPDTQIFASMGFARAWIISKADATAYPGQVHDQASHAEAEGLRSMCMDHPTCTSC